MSAVAGLRSAAAAAVALALVTAACEDRPPPVPSLVGAAGADGLVSRLEAVRLWLAMADGPRDRAWRARRVAEACAVDAPTWRRVVTPPYAPHFARYAPPTADTLGDVAAEVAALVPVGEIRVVPLYADDLELPADLRRARPTFPVGRPPLVVRVDSYVPRVLDLAFLRVDRRWRCMVSTDGLVRRAIADRDPACAAAYGQSASGRCLDLTAPIASAALDGDLAELTRLCTLLVHQGCGSVPAEAPP